MTTDSRYPIGTFQPRPGPLGPERRNELIQAIAAHPANMRAAVAGLSDEQLDTPYRDGGWTVRQVVHHMVDSHLNAYIRFKLAVTEDKPTIRPYDQAAWAESEESVSGPVHMSLTALDGLHERWVAFLRTFSDSDWSRGVHHPEIGDIDLDFLLQMYGWHCPHHEAHVTGLRARMGW